MISKNQIKYINSLRASKFRQKYDNFIAEGEKTVFELLRSQRFPIESLYILDSEINTLRAKYSSILSHFDAVTESEMKAISALQSPTNVLLVAKKKCYSSFNLTDAVNPVFYLDGVQDPGNMGTIIRSADWFGIPSVIRSLDSADFFNPKVVQATMGSLAGVDLYSIDRQDIILQKPHSLIGMDMEGIDIRDANFASNTVFVFGSEGKGISEELGSVLTQSVSIKGYKNRVAESLNVGVTASIVAFQLSIKSL